MINSVTIKQGLPKELGIPNINFRPDLNILWASNGFGKTVLMNEIAKNCLCSSEMGWNTPENFWYESYSRASFRDKIGPRKNYKSFLSHMKESSVIELDWIGSAVYYLSSDKIKDSHRNFSIATSAESAKAFNLSEVVDMMRSHRSSGDSILYQSSRLLDLQVPNHEEILEKYGKYNDYWQAKANIFLTHLKSLNYQKDNRPVLLLDELDSNLSYSNQHLFHTKILTELSKKYQIICISHSIFALLNRDYLIDLDGSSQIALTLLSKILQ